MKNNDDIEKEEGGGGAHSRDNFQREKEISHDFFLCSSFLSYRCGNRNDKRVLLMAPISDIVIFLQC